MARTREVTIPELVFVALICLCVGFEAGCAIRRFLADSTVSRPASSPCQAASESATTQAAIDSPTADAPPSSDPSTNPIAALDTTPAAGAGCDVRPVEARSIMPGADRVTASTQSAPGGSNLLAAIRHVESGGNDAAIGDSGRAKGPYQIHRAYWLDGCRRLGVTWSYDRLVWSAWHCEQVMAANWAAWGCTTDEARARCHNGGPAGATNPRTRAYWAKVQQRL